MHLVLLLALFTSGAVSNSGYLSMSDAVASLAKEIQTGTLLGREELYSKSIHARRGRCLSIRATVCL